MQLIGLIYLNVLIFAVPSSAYKILGIFPIAARSHFIIGDTLFSSLADKGHDVTVISSFSMKDKNYRGIQIMTMEAAFQGLVGDFLQARNSSMWQTLHATFDMGLLTTNTTLNDPSVQKLISSKEQFDLIILELFVTEALFGFSDLFNAPVIAVGLFGAVSWNTDLVGTPSPPSYIPHPFTNLTDHMNLFQRIYNLAVISMEKVLFDYFYLPRQDELFKRHFPNSKKSLEELRRSTALVLLNQHSSLSFSRPSMPNVIEVGGLQINRKRKPLPDAIQIFLDKAKHGAIYFSLGSNIKSSNLPSAKRDAILKTFKSLKQRVLWKFEDTNLPGKSDNVYISNWFPQDDILAHPNVILFITHGGLLSTTESTYHGKPFIGIPIFGDQFLNMARAEANGIGISVDYNDLTEESFKSAITQMLGDPKYTERMRDLSARYRDQPMEPLELAVYWVEYVARHRGAPHLQCAAQKLNIIQYHNIDAFVILYGGILLVACTLLWLMVTAAQRVIGNSGKKTKAKSKRA